MTAGNAGGGGRYGGALTERLTEKTSFLGMRVYVVIGICVGLGIAAALVVVFVFCSNRRWRNRRMRVKHASGMIPIISKEIVEIKSSNRAERVSADRSVIAVKSLLNNKGQAEREFKVEVEAIGKVRHKNLVGLLGYCAEGTQRMLVYEYVENGNLEQWLHGDVGPVSPLTWDVRMKIAIGTAKGLAYLHEGLEPKVVHRDVKSSNILLDKQWNPKVSDFGLAKLLGSDSSYVTTRVMGTFGYVAPEYASTGMLNEGSDVYSFGVLLMELISGRSPVDYGRPSGEVNLVDWFKGKVSSRRGSEVVDPLMEVQPTPRALKRVLLVCLRCIDSDALKRPKMGQVVHMLEADEFPFRTEHRTARETALLPPHANPTMVNRIPLPSVNEVGRDHERSDWR